ncbi:MAG: hypothetical protein COB36_09300 [Alphaproteobacteria bacterium]|nr:MAG: hypothetical protein COB36_09300 [Alphaproteobacteria bacterium]
MIISHADFSDIQSNAVFYKQNSTSPKVLFTCEHATNIIPPIWKNLGMSKEHIEDHIGWDIGALDVTKHLSYLLDQPALYSGFSRLFFDVNRLPDAHDSIPKVSGGISIPRNIMLSEKEKTLRKELVYDPYFDKLNHILNETPSIRTIISIHSCTPTYMGFKRPWEIGILWRDNNKSAHRLIKHLEEDSPWVIGNNQPYDPQEHRISVYEAISGKKNISLVWIEIRNDLISTKANSIDVSVKIHNYLRKNFLF